MHNYTISVTREVDDDFISFPFRFEVTVKLPAAKLWEQWEMTHKNYQKSWLWPTQYSQPVLDEWPPKKGGMFRLTYQIPNPHDPSRPKKNAAYQFHILEWDNDEMLFAYRATDDHPFLEGGGSVKVSPIDDNRCRLVWEGKYRHAAGDPGKEAQGDVFAFFLCSFFTATAQNIKKQVGV